MKVTRRQFSASVLAGTLSGLTQVSAQPGDTMVVGVEHGHIVQNAGTYMSPHSYGIEDYTTLPAATSPVRALQALAVRYLNVQSHHVTSTFVNQAMMAPSDRISGVTYLADGTLVVAITPDGASVNGGSATRLVVVGGKDWSPRSTARVIPVSGLSMDQALDSLLLLKSGTLIGMVTNKDGTGPAHVVNVDSSSGAVTFTNLVSLPADRRFSCLAEAPDGTLYTSVFRANATTELWTLDLTGHTAAMLLKLSTFDGMAGTVPWYHGIQSLITMPAGQLIGLCNLEYRLPDSIYAINLNTGFMTEVAGFPVSRAALATAGAKKI